MITSRYIDDYDQLFIDNKKYDNEYEDDDRIRRSRPKSRHISPINVVIILFINLRK